MNTSTIVRPNRFEKLKSEADKAKADLVEVRGALLRLVQTLSERDQAIHEREMLEAQLVASRDHLRVLIADRIVKHGPFAISDVEQDEAYRHADQVQILPDEGTRVTRFELLPGIALRELPPKLAPGTPDTPSASETAAPEDEAPALHAVAAMDENKEPS